MAKSKVEYWLTDDGLTLLKGWARDGLTDEDIANNIGIAQSTLYEWKKKYSDISESLKKYKEIPDYKVENALYKRASGFEHTYRTQKVTKDGDVVGYKVTVYYPPDPTSIIFWLKNRQPKKWRDKVEMTSDDEKMKEINKNISNIASMINNPQKNRNEEDVQ
ncbi:MAG: helix-turn-helix domain-containing protein [Bacilli bacterium]|nr:helix-turn-helix domain-containing protein [Bacilli bacterium]